MQLPLATRLINGFLDIVAGGYEIKTASLIATQTGATPLLAPVTSRKLRVLSYRIQARAANTQAVTAGFVDSDGAAIVSAPSWDLNPREGAIPSALPVGYEFETPSGKGLSANLSASQAVMYHVIYCEV